MKAADVKLKAVTIQLSCVISPVPWLGRTSVEELISLTELDRDPWERACDTVGEVRLSLAVVLDPTFDLLRKARQEATQLTSLYQKPAP